MFRHEIRLGMNRRAPQSHSGNAAMINHQTYFPVEFQGQKRNSTDAGVQTEPVVAAPAAEKSK